MNLVNLKSTSDEATCAPMSQDKYGYGLRICLNDDQCEALGITQAVKAGTLVTIQAKAIVVSATESVEDDGDDAGNDVQLTLQITDMGLAVGSVLKDAAQTLYGDDK